MMEGGHGAEGPLRQPEGDLQVNEIRNKKRKRNPSPLGDVVNQYCDSERQGHFTTRDSDVISEVCETGFMHNVSVHPMKKRAIYLAVLLVTEKNGDDTARTVIAGLDQTRPCPAVLRFIEDIIAVRRGMLDKKAFTDFQQAVAELVSPLFTVIDLDAIYKRKKFRLPEGKTAKANKFYHARELLGGNPLNKEDVNDLGIPPGLMFALQRTPGPPAFVSELILRGAVKCVIKDADGHECGLEDGKTLPFSRAKEDATALWNYMARYKECQLRVVHGHAKDETLPTYEELELLFDVNKPHLPESEQLLNVAKKHDVNSYSVWVLRVLGASDPFNNLFSPLKPFLYAAREFRLCAGRERYDHRMGISQEEQEEQFKEEEFQRSSYAQYGVPDSDEVPPLPDDEEARAAEVAKRAQLKERYMNEFRKRNCGDVQHPGCANTPCKMLRGIHAVILPPGCGGGEDEGTAKRTTWTVKDIVAARYKAYHDSVLRGPRRILDDCFVLAVRLLYPQHEEDSIVGYKVPEEEEEEGEGNNEHDESSLEDEDESDDE